MLFDLYVVQSNYGFGWGDVADFNCEVYAKQFLAIANNTVKQMTVDNPSCNDDPLTKIKYRIIKRNMIDKDNPKLLGCIHAVFPTVSVKVKYKDKISTIVSVSETSQNCKQSRLNERLVRYQYCVLEDGSHQSITYVKYGTGDKQGCYVIDIDGV